MFLIIPIIALIWVFYVIACAFTRIKMSRAVEEYLPIPIVFTIILMGLAVITTFIHRI